MGDEGATTVADLVHRGVDLARAYLSADEDTRTVYVRDLAEILVDIRERFADPQGRGPDYTGRTQAYREAVSTLFRALDGEALPAEIRRLRDTARYHVSVALRRRLDADTLTRYGLHLDSGKDRNRARSNQRRALVRAVEDLDEAPDDDLLSARLVHRARHLLSLVEGDQLPLLSPEEQASVDEALAEMLVLALELRQVLRPARRTAGTGACPRGRG